MRGKESTIVKTARRSLALVVAVSIAFIGTVLAASPASAAGSAVILATWHDAENRPVVLRDGVYTPADKKGFGWQKITLKHKITDLDVVGFVAHAPDGGAASGADWLYLAYAVKNECDPGCHPVQQVPVRLIVARYDVESYYGVAINDQLGVKTMYCDNDDRADDCPSWVNDALGKRSSAGYEVTWSYTPVELK